jgi:uncharacterized small protein (DUF1192 family)
MSKFKEQLLTNSYQVRDAERRLAIQHSFIERLRASARDTRSAEEALEVMRGILGGLYQKRFQLRRKVTGHKLSSRSPQETRRATKPRFSAGARN